MPSQIINDKDVSHYVFSNTESIAVTNMSEAASGIKSGTVMPTYVPALIGISSTCLGCFADRNHIVRLPLEFFSPQYA